MKANNLFYITMTFGLLLTISFVWSIIELFTADYNYWSVGSFTILLFITGWLGIEYANRVKKDPKATVDSFLGKTSIIILLVGLSLGCSGQNDSIKDNTGIWYDDNGIAWGIKSPVDVQNCKAYKTEYGHNLVSDTSLITTGGFYLGSTTIIGARVNICDRNVTTDLLLEYKKECFNDSTLIKVNINPDRNTTNGMGGTTCLYYPPKWVDRYVSKTPSFPDFLNWIEKRKTK